MAIAAARPLAAEGVIAVFVGQWPVMGEMVEDFRQAMPARVR